jgi:hypothetical protein
MEVCPWEEFRVNENNRSVFSEVYHICHISDAIRIIEDKRIVSSLIWDESCLNNTRTLVSWVSPNKWDDSLYGQIAFVFHWESLVKKKIFYWVESMRQYHPKAFRIMISDRDYASTDISNLLVPFDPAKKGGGSL